MEIIIGKYKIYPLDRLNWTIAELCERTDKETGETTMQWVRREKYYSCPQYAAEYIYDQLLRDSNGKVTLDSTNAADVARLCEESCNEVVRAVNAIAPDDLKRDYIDLGRKVVLADPESFKQRRRRKPAKKTAPKKASKPDSSDATTTANSDTTEPVTDAQAAPEPTEKAPKSRHRKKTDA